MIERFKENIKKLNLFSEKEKLLLAVSGGVDSVVLCELCRQAGYGFTIAHCNFQLRGEESERDERFVKELGKKYGVEVLVKKFDTEKYAAENKVSIQEAARDLRYAWFKECIESGKIAEKVLSGHHADDNIETLLMNFFRGTGIKGLTGIPLKTGYVRRPLLGMSREELVAFAREQGLTWVEDSSNLSSDYTRNYFRNELIPGLSKVFPEVKKNLTGNIYRFIDIGKLFSVVVGEYKKKLVRQKGNEYYIPIRQLLALNNRTIIYLIIRDFGFSEKQIGELIRLGESQSGKYIVSPNQEYRIIRHGHWFIISPAKTGESENIIIEEDSRSVLFPGDELQIEILNS
ncbi:MAG TPA: tRNA lysidine(34) synthetase TilS, partial [Chitinophagaceae bacterium]|nr:tRNA lysidine(34) synthetase TilS [Chitinophagaceae bacterium]